LSTLLPSPAIQSAIAPVALAAVARVEPYVATPSEDGRGWPRARGGTTGTDRTRAQTILPPHRGEGSARGQRHARAQDNPAYWPTAAFFAQHLSQEALPDDAPSIGHAAGAAKYPSLAFEFDIILPGGAMATPEARASRVDITV
jgi:hypothetical protein